MLSADEAADLIEAIASRQDRAAFANLFRQDFPVLGFTSQLSLVHNRNNEKDRAYDSNGFLVRPAFVGDVRPHRYHVTYLGYSGDGHFGRWNLSTSAYAAIGSDEHNPIAQKAQRIRAGFLAGEVSRDYSWVRLRGPSPMRATPPRPTARYTASCVLGLTTTGISLAVHPRRSELLSTAPTAPG